MIFRTILCLLLTALSADNALAQKDPSQAATHDAIRELRDNLMQAVNSHDTEALITHLHPQVVLTAQDGDQLVSLRGHAAVRDYMERLLTGPDAGVTQMTIHPEVDDLTILHGNDSGIAYGSSRDEYTLRSGSEFSLSTRWSATVVNNDGQWQLAAFHVSSNLFDNPVLNMLQQSLWWTGAAAALIGLLAGAIISKFCCRRRLPTSSANPAADVE